MTDTINATVPAIFMPAIDALNDPSSRIKYIGLEGGRASAKSHTVAEALVLKAYRTSTRVACIREVQSSIKDSVKQLLIDKIQQFQLQEYFTVLESEIRSNTNESQFIFKGMRDYNAANIKSLEGTDDAWVEEAQTLSHQSLRLLRPTIRKPHSHILMTYNPRHRTDAVDLLFRGPAANRPPQDMVLFIHSSYKDNPHLPADLLKEIESDYANNPAEAQHIWGGGYEIITAGAYYAQLVATLQNNNQITKVPYDPALDVYAAIDLGISDNTAIWIFQRNAKAWQFMKFYQNNNQALKHYTDYLEELPYKIDTVFLPHDANARELQTGITRRDFFENRGFETQVLERDTVEQGIAAVRQTLPMCYFDEEGCADGLDCLRSYHAEYDEEARVQKLRPLHDWASHGADGFRYAIMGGHIIPNHRSDWSIAYTRNLQLVP